MIFAGSRYQNANVIIVQDQNGNSKQFVTDRNRLTARSVGEDFQEITAKTTDLFDSLSYQQTNRSDQWWVIADVNERVKFPLDDLQGERLVVPGPSFFVRA